MSSRFANAIRFLSIDSVQQANSGHPGMPMGMADIAEVLWRNHLNVNPTNPAWANRDRFVLSNGHGSMLLYSLLHLTGYDLSLDELKHFRQWDSKTPGHPEYRDTPGVETTTGPLGQGLANAVGMAIAEKALAAEFNRGDFEVVDHHTYVFVGDGCLMEGVSHEACSLAGTLGLGKLIVFWDDNGISIDGKVEGWFTDDTPKRFEAYGWHVVADIDGHNQDQIESAIQKAHEVSDKPTLICCKTHIGYGSPNKADSAGAHGAPLGADEINLVRDQLDWPYAPFDVPEDIYAAWDLREKGILAEQAWDAQFTVYQEQYPILAHEFVRRLTGQLPADFYETAVAFIQQCDSERATLATRKASQKAIEAYAPMLPELIGGSADLTGSNNTNWSGSKVISRDDFSGNYLCYGVREFAMAAIINGLNLHGSFVPYGGTFLVFSDYARNAIRMAALMGLHVVHVFTHDSIGLGEDGPTHQPVEHAASLRIIPGLNVWRPCDATETAVAWEQAIVVHAPHCLLLSRQNLPGFSHADHWQDIKRGGYILLEPDVQLEAIIIATGSEVALAMDAATALNAEGRGVRVVSMPCADVFKAQDAAYREKVLPIAVLNRVAIEAGVSDYWYQFVGLEGEVIGLDHFGASAPANVLFERFGFTVQAVKEAVTV